jgi:hypothetical protein
MLFGWWSVVVNTTAEDGSELPVYLTGAVAGTLSPNGSLPEQLSFSGAAVIPRRSALSACDPYGWSRYDHISGYITVSSVVGDTNQTVLRLSLALNVEHMGGTFWNPPRLEWYPRFLGPARPGAMHITNIAFAGALGTSQINGGYYMPGTPDPRRLFEAWLCTQCIHAGLKQHAAAAAAASRGYHEQVCCTCMRIHH